MKSFWKKQGRLCFAALAAVLLFDLFLAWAVPYSATDDWLWGMEEGLRWWLGGLLNGRYAGNGLAVVMCRSQAVKTLVMGVFMFALPLLMALLAVRGDRRLFLPSFFACAAGILLMPAVMWQEPYGWVSGFGNYVVPTALFLVWLIILRHVAQVRGHLAAWSAALFLLSLTMGLFVENLTVLFLGASVLLAVYSLWDRQLLLPFWACLAGGTLAVFLMFSNGLFAELASTGEALNGLRTLNFSLADSLPEILSSLLNWYLCRLLPIAFIRGVHLAWPMAVITACAFWNSRLRPLCLLGLFPAVHSYLILKTQILSSPLALAASCISWSLPLLALLAQRDGRQLKLRRVLLYLSAPLALAPLAATPALGQRFYFFPLIILVLSATDAAAPLLSHLPCALLAGALAAALMLYWGTIQYHVLSCTQLRDQLIQEAAETGRDTLVLPTGQSTAAVCYSPNPWDAEYASYFRRFYHVAEDVTLIFLPAGSYESWPDITPEQWDRRLELPPSRDFTPSLP